MPILYTAHGHATGGRSGHGVAGGTDRGRADRPGPGGGPGCPGQRSRPAFGCADRIRWEFLLGRGCA